MSVKCMTPGGPQDAALWWYEQLRCAAIMRDQDAEGEFAYRLDRVEYAWAARGGERIDAMKGKRR